MRNLQKFQKISENFYRNFHNFLGRILRRSPLVRSISLQTPIPSYFQVCEQNHFCFAPCDIIIAQLITRVVSKVSGLILRYRNECVK